MNIGTLVPRHARYRGDATAVVCGDERLTWRDLATRVNRVANVFQSLGLVKGDAVAIATPNAVELLEIYWGLAQAGLVSVPLSPLLRGSALSVLLNDADVKAIITSADVAGEVEKVRSELPLLPPHRHLVLGGSVPGLRSYADAVAAASSDAPPAVDIAGSDVYNIVYSSGTTGTPKGIVHTHDIRAGYCTLFANAWRMTPESVVIHAGSLVFNGAFLTLMPALFLGCKYVLQCHFDAAEFIANVEREQVTHVFMVPSQIVAVLNSPAFSRERLASLQMLGSVGAPLHAEHKARLTSQLPGIFHELYGLTEGVMTILDRDQVSAKGDSVGCAPPFMEVKVCDEQGVEQPAGEVGEIVGRGPLLMPGYHKRPDLTAHAIRDGWMYTGDMGFMDADGFLHLVDRKKDLIISGGVNVYPRDIEEVLVTHPAVLEAAVFGVPDEKWGETPLGAVVLKSGVAATSGELKAFVNARVGARYQQVRDVAILSAFPRNAAGKVLKREMRAEYWEGKAVKI
ncbi:MAG: AMP-dependent synthetase and ligase [Gemmatimonadetes bacterium]|nr:AMP-dependent synthetase and ligase [Gemmatimonadota bacterium]